MVSSRRELFEEGFFFSLPPSMAPWSPLGQLTMHTVDSKVTHMRSLPRKSETRERKKKQRRKKQKKRKKREERERKRHSSSEDECTATAIRLSYVKSFLLISFPSLSSFLCAKEAQQALPFSKVCNRQPTHNKKTDGKKVANRSFLAKEKRDRGS